MPLSICRWFGSVAAMRVFLVLGSLVALASWDAASRRFPLLSQRLRDSSERVRARIAALGARAESSSPSPSPWLRGWSSFARELAVGLILVAQLLELAHDNRLRRAQGFGPVSLRSAGFAPGRSVDPANFPNRRGGRRSRTGTPDAASASELSHEALAVLCQVTDNRNGAAVRRAPSGVMTLRHLLHAVAETARVSAPTLLDAGLGRLTRESCDARLDSWSRRIVEHAKIELTTIGLEHAPPDESMVVMSNHQSLYDIPLLYRALRRPLRMVAKRELFRVPLWGSAMRSAGFVEIDRSDRARAIESLSNAKSLLAQGVSLWIAPEGTRSADGRLGPFKRGGFHLAEEAGSRILPVTVVGSDRVLGARGRTVHDGVAVSVVLHPPVDPKNFGPERRNELIAAVRSAIASALGEGTRSEPKMAAASAF
jgi:1-acyl-sn-glycerol-3-phosphate acyltransferase